MFLAFKDGVDFFEGTVFGFYPVDGLGNVSLWKGEGDEEGEREGDIR